MGWNLIRSMSIPSCGAGKHTPARTPLTPQPVVVSTISNWRGRVKMPDEQDQNYSVGYAKPPLHTRFQKGQSGNRKGSPVGARNTATLFDKTSNERGRLQQTGPPTKTTQAERTIEQVFI